MNPLFSLSHKKEFVTGAFVVFSLLVQFVCLHRVTLASSVPSYICPYLPTTIAFFSNGIHGICCGWANLVSGKFHFPD